MQSLAKLVSDKADFDSAFEQSVAIDIREQGYGSKNQNKLDVTRRSSDNQRIGVIMEGSREFVIGTRAFDFDEREPIFFMQAPISVQQHVNLQEGCNTCGSKWQKAGDLANSHCDFCGISNCKNCLSKTQNFRQDPKASMVSASPSAEPVRGKCCKLCDRKFFIKDMIQNSGNLIKVQNLTIDNALRQTKKWSGDIADEAAENRRLIRNEEQKEK